MTKLDRIDVAKALNTARISVVSEGFMRWRLIVPHAHPKANRVMRFKERATEWRDKTTGNTWWMEHFYQSGDAFARLKEIL